MDFTNLQDASQADEICIDFDVGFESPCQNQPQNESTNPRVKKSPNSSGSTDAEDQDLSSSDNESDEEVERTDDEYDFDEDEVEEEVEQERAQGKRVSTEALVADIMHVEAGQEEVDFIEGIHIDAKTLHFVPVFIASTYRIRGKY
jgi:hypothetical protein